MAKEEETLKDDVKEDTRMHFRDYLRMTEIVAIMILLVVVVVGLAFRDSAPITTVVSHAPVATSTPLLAPVVETDHFVMTDIGKIEGSAKENIATADPKIFSAPVNFKSFTYDVALGKKITLAGTCKDAFYALLIFKSSDDYRANPTRSYYNSAYECPKSGLIALELDLKSINLPSGSYYLFLADQGNKGSWYNPR